MGYGGEQSRLKPFRRASPEDFAVQAGKSVRLSGRALHPDRPRRIISKRGRYYLEEIHHEPFNTKKATDRKDVIDAAGKICSPKSAVARPLS